MSGFPTLDLPDLQRATLKSGLRVILAERHEVPTVEMQLIVDAGYAADQFATPGTASLTMAMSDEGTKSRNALEISEDLDNLAANLGAGAGLDTCTVTLSSLKEHLADSLDIFADVLLNPSFPEKDLERLKRQQLARIQQEKSTPWSIALRLLPGPLNCHPEARGTAIGPILPPSSVQFYAVRAIADVFFFFFFFLLLLPPPPWHRPWRARPSCSTSWPACGRRRNSRSGARKARP